MPNRTALSRFQIPPQSVAELEQIGGLRWLWNKPRWSYLTHYTWKPASLKATCTCVLLHLSTDRNRLLSWPRLPALVMLFCKLAVALIKLRLAPLSDIRRHHQSVQVLKYAEKDEASGRSFSLTEPSGSSAALDPDGQDVTGRLKWLSVIDLRTDSIPSIPHIIPEGSNTGTHAD